MISRVLFIWQFIIHVSLGLTVSNFPVSNFPVSNFPVSNNHESSFPDMSIPDQLSSYGNVIICCYYRQHYHNAYCNGDTTNINPTNINPTDINPTNINPTNINPTNINPTDINPTDINPTDINPTNINPTNSGGCIITPAIISGPPILICGNSVRCMPPDGLQGYWLEGFELNCEECLNII